MNFLLEIYKNPFKYVFFLLLILYILLYMPLGLEDGDMGSIFGISWSMYNGAFPYRDFVYIKPPFSPYFHSLPLYISEEYGYVFNRGFYFVQVFLYSYFASRLLFKTFKLPYKNLVYFVAILGAMVSIHNYPPMPWNTIDGVFFSVLGLTFLFTDRQKTWHILIAALFISLGVLCKQSFYFFPVFISIYLLSQRAYKKVGLFIGFGILFAASFLGVLYANGAFELFFDQMFSFTSSSSLVSTGIKSYYLSVKFNLIYIVIIGALLYGAHRFLPRRISYLLLHLTIAGVFVYLYATYGGYYVKKHGIAQILWLGVVVICIVKFRKTKAYLFLLLMLSLAWCASISNGFNTPIDFSIPVFFGIFTIFYAAEKNQFPKWVGLAIVTVFAGTFYYGYEFVYRDSNRSELTYNMSEVFPKLHFVKSDRETFEKYNELKQLAAKYENYTILPSMTLGHYLTNTVNPIGVDWVFNHHLSDQLPQYIERLEANNITVFMEDIDGHIDNYEESSSLTIHVRDHWKLVEVGEHFRVYRKQ